jgi:basic membrane lipoprotein Med (substrate-binding protein (PBP1-ABC) superfamily)
MRRYRVGLDYYKTIRASNVRITTMETNVEERLLRGRFGLVVWVVDDKVPAVRELVERLPATKFVFVDTSLETLSLEGVRNVSAIRFAVEQMAELIGYLSGLVPPLNSSPAERADVVGIVGGFRTSQAERNLAGFKRGLEATRPGVRVLVDYANETEEHTRCEQLANAQIDRGADIVVALAGRCGSGAVEVARVRGVWGAGDNDATSYGADVAGHVLIRLDKQYEMAMDNALTRFLERSLPQGKDLVLGLNDNYAVGMTTSFRTPGPAVSRMVARCTEIRRRTLATADF